MLAALLAAAGTRPVEVFFSVENERGQFITGLSEQEITVFEDGKLQFPTRFRTAASIPLALTFVLDMSGSTRDLDFGKDAVVQLFRKTVDQDQDRGAVIAFNQTAYLLQDFTSDPAVLESSIRGISRTKATGGTALYDALFLAARQIAGARGRKVLIVVTDGVDTKSRISFNAMRKELARAGAAVFVLLSGSSQTLTDDGKRAMSRVAEETGGRIFGPPSNPTFENVLQKIGIEINNQYAVTWESSNTKPDGKLRKIRIEAGAKDVRFKNVKWPTHHRPGYYFDEPVPAR